MYSTKQGSSACLWVVGSVTIESLIIKKNGAVVEMLAHSSITDIIKIKTRKAKK